MCGQGGEKYLFVCSSKRRERDVSSPTVHDLIAILQHELCEEIGQLASFLPHCVASNQMQMKACSNNHVFAGSSSGGKQQLEINMKSPTCPGGENHKRTKSENELLIRSY